MIQNNLLSGWKTTGVEQEALDNLIEDVTTHTKVVQSSNVDFYFLGEEPVTKERLWMLCPGNPLVEGYGSFIDADSVRAQDAPFEGISDALYDEMNIVGMMADIRDMPGQDHHCMIMDRALLSDFALVGITGRAALHPKWALLALVKEMVKDQTVSFVVRWAEENGHKIEKIVAMRSKTYGLFPQTDGLRIFEETFPEAKISWYIDNYETEVRGTFERSRQSVGETDITPCVTFTTSDAGTSSLSYQLGFEVSRGPQRQHVLMNQGTCTVSRKHSGIWDQTLYDEIKTKVVTLRDHFTLLQHRLEELKGEMIEMTDLDVVVENLFVDSGFKKLHAKNIAAYMAMIHEEISRIGATTVDGCTLVTTIIEIAGRETVAKNLNREANRAVQKALGDLPFCKVKRTIGKKTEGE